MSDTLTKVDFTIDDVIQKVREVAAENPNHVYEGDRDEWGGAKCYYRDPEDRSKPGCIVGQALDRLGYVVPPELEGSHAVAVLESVFNKPLKGNSSARWIRKVQGQQDGGTPWGEAVEYADIFRERVAKELIESVPELEGVLQPSYLCPESRELVMQHLGGKDGGN